jgi:hypothetical protein
VLLKKFPNRTNAPHHRGEVVDGTSGRDGAIDDVCNVVIFGTKESAAEVWGATKT